MSVIMSGLETVQNLPMTVAAPVALFVAYIPLAGTLAAIVSAVAAWNCSWLVAGLIFALPSVAIVAIGHLGALPAPQRLGGPVSRIPAVAMV
ncbi:MAG: hypothetical protein IPK66_09435 [Rhodospirillales bacterium]|nr:hypothetical protein [Rhodospirillales bacterium]